MTVGAYSPEALGGTVVTLVGIGVGCWRCWRAIASPVEPLASADGFGDWTTGLASFPDWLVDTDGLFDFESSAAAKHQLPNASGASPEAFPRPALLASSSPGARTRALAIAGSLGGGPAPSSTALRSNAGGVAYGRGPGDAPAVGTAASPAHPSLRGLVPPRSRAASQVVGLGGQRVVSPLHGTPAVERTDGFFFPCSPEA